ncbi:hypothetical protein ASF83_04660 [Plantibacter sp. Leaf171]|nr:hypothetical protein ASE44_04675 [Plantibacter sp. Leaf1]KQR58425.1 hypothetical protein ASF83_04660 [Plantibacter sp. Leaf171]
MLLCGFRELFALAMPLVHFVVAYWLAAGSLDGFLEYLPIAALQSAGGFAVSTLHDPGRAVLLASLGGVT